MLILLLVILIFPSLAQAVEYLATYEPHPTEAGVFYAHSNIRGTTCVSLRPDPTKQAGYAYCTGPSLPVRAGIIALNADGSLSTKQKTDLAAVTGKAVTETRMQDVVSGIVDANSIPMKRWKDGRQHLWINGKEVWSRPAPLATYIPTMKEVLLAPVQFAHWLITPTLAWAASFAETFTATDGVIDGCEARGCTLTWDHFQGAALNILTNRAARSGSVSLQLARATGSTLATDDMKVGMTLSEMTIASATNIGAGPIMRKQAGNTTQTYLYCVAFVSSTSDFVAYGERTAGAGSDTGTVTVAISNNDIIGGAVLNDSVVCLVNGVRVLGPTTITTGSGFTEAGIRMSGAGTVTSTVTAVDGWYAEDITVLPGGDTRRPIAPLVLQ